MFDTHVSYRIVYIRPCQVADLGGRRLDSFDCHMVIRMDRYYPGLRFGKMPCLLVGLIRFASDHINLKDHHIW